MRLPTWNWRSAISQPQAFVTNLPPQVWTGLFRAACCLAPVVLFLCFFNPYIIDPTKIGWVLEADWGQHVLGWNAYRHCADSFNHQTCLAAPVGNSLMSLDANPPFAFLFKPFSDLLPDQFQYIGPWFAMCVALHFFVAYRLVRPHAPGRWAAFGGAIILSLLPILYYRMRHDTLVAQFLVLWGLHIFINVQSERAKMWHWIALLGFAGLLHPYLLFMIAAIWGGDVLRRFWPAARTFDRKALLDLTWRSAAALMAPIVTMGLAGTYTKGMASGAGGWGYYTAGIDSFFNPVRQDFSNILKATPLNGGQSFEGYQYLGFGLLMLIVTAVVLYLTSPEAKRARDYLKKLWPLALPMLCLALIAISNNAKFFNMQVWNFPLPEQLKGPAAILRASGRMMWPIAYLLILSALVVLYKARPKVIAIMLPLVIAVQAYDIAGFAAAMRKATGLAQSDQVYYLTPSPLWDKLVKASDGVDFYPANIHLNQKLFYEVTWRATSNKLPVNTMYAARENLMQIAHQDAGQDAFKNGDVKPNHLLVFLKQCDAPANLRSRLRMLDGVWILPPDKAMDLPLDKPVWDPIRSEVRFGWLDQGTCMLDQNWSRPDTEGTWSEGPDANVVIPIQHVEFDTPKPRKLELNLKAKSRRPVQVSVMVNDVKVDEIELNPRASEHTITLPASALRKDALKIRFVVIPPEPVATEGGAESSASASSRGGRGQVARKPEPQTAQSLGIKLINIRLSDPDAEPDEDEPAPPVLKTWRPVSTS
ncbi:hypothetical protein ABAC460_21055 [Asticcacaulis sp. AC460]|uniref:DUF6311 domain-containing protein n=1 Tax=Asticcacaulis sp. AC460 TaxID=1282360 RepID=UPI0003C3D119|nr:DUF6311 domain-containing protein [Asticcacaulis sp. AC460]ESQ87060.1 hypothetical protein ABAC460_21055 [Asticcacaulis sp. AC460]